MFDACTNGEHRSALQVTCRTRFCPGYWFSSALFMSNIMGSSPFGSPAGQRCRCGFRNENRRISSRISFTEQMLRGAAVGFSCQELQRESDFTFSALLYFQKTNGTVLCMRWACHTVHFGTKSLFTDWYEPGPQIVMIQWTGSISISLPICIQSSIKAIRSRSCQVALFSVDRGKKGPRRFFHLRDDRYRPQSRSRTQHTNRKDRAH